MYETRKYVDTCRNPFLQDILDKMRSRRECAYLMIERDKETRQVYRIIAKHTGAVSPYMKPARLQVWFDAYLAGMNNRNVYETNKRKELNL